MTEKRYGVINNFCVCEYVDDVERFLNFDEVVDILSKQDMMIESQEKQLQKQHEVIVEQDNRIEMLEDEIEEHKAVINKEWNEYLKKKGLL